MAQGNPGRSKRIYTNEEKASVFVTLQINEGNVNRTAKECGIPLATVRYWRKHWLKNGIEPELKEIVGDVFEGHVERTEKARNMALSRLTQLIPDIKNAKEAAVVFSILEDRLRIAKGLSTSKSETVQKIELPKPEDVQQLMRVLTQGAIDSATVREVEIYEVEQAELKALNPGGS